MVLNYFPKGNLVNWAHEAVDSWTGAWLELTERRYTAEKLTTVEAKKKGEDGAPHWGRQPMTQWRGESSGGGGNPRRERHGVQHGGVRKLGTGCGSESWGGEGSPFIGSRWWWRFSSASSAHGRMTIGGLQHGGTRSCGSVVWGRGRRQLGQVGRVG
jgi:hypothetical protein